MQKIDDILTYREKSLGSEEEAPLQNNQRKHIELRKKKTTCEGVIGRGVGNPKSGKKATYELGK